MIDLIYDTLFNNKQYEQFNCDNVNDQIVDYSKNQIEFEYNNKKYVIKMLEA
jgi:hypothetical protein